MAAGLGAESLAARFKVGDGLGGYLGRWLLLEAAGGDVEAEGNLATSRQIPLTRTVVGEKLNMEDIGTSWYPKGKSVATRALLGAGLEVGDVMVFRATKTESSGRKAKYIAFETRPTKAADEDYPTKRRAAASPPSSSSTDSSSSPPEKKQKATPAAPSPASSSSPSSGAASESAYELRVLHPSENTASQYHLYYNADAPVEDYEMELDGASRAGKPATRSPSSADDGEPPSKKPKPRFNAHGKYTAAEKALETALAQAIDMGFEL